MKKFILLLLASFSIAIHGQDIVYNFNTDTENFEQGGFPNFAHNANGYVTTGDATTFTGGFQALRTPDNLNLSESQYRIVRIVVENSTPNTEWQLMNLENGSTSGSTAGLTEVIIPTVTSGSGFTTYDIAITTNPNNADGIIHRIGFRAKQNNSFDWSAGGELKIAQIVIIDTDQWISNSGFENSSGWTANGADITSGYTTTNPYRGSQAGTVTFTQNATTAGNWFENDTYDFGETVGLTGDEITVNFWVKSSRAGVNVRTRWQFYDASGSLVGSAQFSGVTAIVAADTWQEVSFSKTGITDDFNQIKLSLGIHNNGVAAQAGDVISFDFVTSNFNTFTTSNSWTGGTDSDWSNATNWTNGVVPSSTLDSDIQVSSNYPIIGATTAATVNNLTVNSGANLTVSSGGSLIISGTSIGNVTYNRTLSFTSGNLEGWHLVSSPVAGQIYDDSYVTNNDIASGSGSNRGIATYDNTVASNNWTYLQSGGSGTFGTGTGYSVKRGTSAGDISFTGTINTSDVSVPITVGAGSGFNLIGNPYTSYVNSATLLTTNTALLDSQTIWVWNPSTKNYEAKTTGDAFQLAPGQGFFVNASTGGSFVIAEATQSHQTDTFLKSAGNPEIILNITDGDLARYAKVKYQDGATLGFDNGYDGETFTGVANSLDVFTKLIDNKSLKNYQVQSLPNTDLESMIIPVSISSVEAKEITFTAEALNLPTDYKVYLEDRENNTVVRLDEDNANYKTNVKAGVTDGRFYLYARTSGVLATDSEILSSIGFYKINNSTLRVVGLQKGKVTLDIFSTLGKNVFKTSFDASSSNDISIPNLSTGIYIVNIKATEGKLSKKIILE